MRQAAFPFFRRPVPALTILVCGLIAMSAAARCDALSEPIAPPLQRWAYLIPESLRADDFEGRLAAYDIMCLGVYRLNARGELYRRPLLNAAERALLRRTRSSKELVPLISLRGARDGAILLASPAHRARAIDALIELIHAESYDGLHIDFEYLSAASALDYARFLAELKERLDRFSRARTLSIAAFPPLHGTADQAAFFDLNVIGQSFEEIVYMTYDYHLERPGPVTHLYWARQNMERVLAQNPRAKIYLGIPAYGYDWPAPGSGGKSGRRVVDEAAGLRQCERYGCTRQDSGTLRVNRTDRIVDFADAETRRRMTELARALGLHGTALWRIGFEVPDRGEAVAP